jgi:hypothetical protein
MQVRILGQVNNELEVMQKEMTVARTSSTVTMFAWLD